MPLHFQSYLPDGEDEKRNEILSNILTKDIEKPDDVYVSEDKKSFHITKHFTNRDTNEKIGKIIISIKERETTNEIIDVDITLNNENPCEVEFVEKLDESSEATEYYQVAIDEKRFEIETANHFILEGKEILSKELDVHLSVFPFHLNVYNSMQEINSFLGFTKPINAGVTEMKITGFAKDFLGVGSAISKQIHEPCSFIIGEVKSFKDIVAIIGDVEVPMTIIQLETGMGLVPVVTSRMQFNLSNLSEGKMIMMFADVKADFKV